MGRLRWKKFTWEEGILIGRDQGILPHMYNAEFRWNGCYDVVYCMCGTDILKANKMGTRLLQTCRAMNYYPHGVEPEQHWAISPPCAGLQDLALQI
eukprot:8802293-Prorocentrum_lima.AAC.1